MASRRHESPRDGITIADAVDRYHRIGNALDPNHHLPHTNDHGPSAGLLVQRGLSANPMGLLPSLSQAQHQQLTAGSTASPCTPSQPSRPPLHRASMGAKATSESCGPAVATADTSNSLSPTAVLACLAYAAASTLVTLLNKVVFSHSQFHYPWTTLAVQNILSILLIEVGYLVGLTRAGRYSKKLARDMSIPVFYFVLFVFTNAQSTRHISIPVLTVWKALGPMFVTLFERFYFGDVFSSRVYAAMVLIVLSAFVTAMNDLEYSLVGYLWAAGNVVANVAYLASLRIYLRAPGVSALDKTFHSNLISLLPMAVLAYASDETPDVIKDFRTTSFTFKLIFVFSGFLTTAVCATAFWVISLTNGSTLSFIGGMNKIPMILISLVMFETRISWAGWFGVFLGVIAGIVFMRAKSIVPQQANCEGQAVGAESAPSKDTYVKHGAVTVSKSGVAIRVVAAHMRAVTMQSGRWETGDGSEADSMTQGVGVRDQGSRADDKMNIRKDDDGGGDEDDDGDRNEQEAEIEMDVHGEVARTDERLSLMKNDMQ